jgi:hypothetical protein
MKFYKDKDKDKGMIIIHSSIIIDNMLDAIWSSYGTALIIFFKNGKAHNSKNAAYVRNSGYEEFYLNGICYGNQDDFTKKSWRRFAKMQAFL